VSVADLANDPAKAAYLAALVQSPYFYSSAGTDPDAAKALRARWNYVLDGMVSQGWLSKARRAGLTFPATVAYQPNDLAGSNGYLVNTAMSALDTMHATNPNVPDSDMIARGGYTVVTTFRTDYLAAIRGAVTNDLAGLRPATNPADRDVHVGMAVVDNLTGALLGIYGGANYVKQGYNDATQAKGPIGSAVSGPLVDSVSSAGHRDWPTVVAALAQRGITDVAPKDDPPTDDDLTATPLRVAAAYTQDYPFAAYHPPYEVSEVLQGGQAVWQMTPPVQNPTSAKMDQFLRTQAWSIRSGHDGADQWAWSVGTGANVSVAVDMYATVPGGVRNRSLKRMTGPTATDRTGQIVMGFLKAGPAATSTPPPVPDLSGVSGPPVGSR
jgi:hypothetical protein